MGNVSGCVRPINTGQMGVALGACYPELRHDEAMTWDWDRLATAMKGRRRQLGMTQAELAEEAGVSESTIQHLESGETRTRLPRSLRSIERALHWEPGSGEALLRGEAASSLPVQTAPAPPADMAVGMPVRVRNELSKGRVVDTAVADVPRPGGGRFILVWKADDGDDIDPADLAEWTRLQRELHEMPRRPTPGT